MLLKLKNILKTPISTGKILVILNVITNVLGSIATFLSLQAFETTTYGSNFMVMIWRIVFVITLIYLWRHRS